MDTRALAGVLRWYADMGVDLAVEDAPRNRFDDAAIERAKAAESAPAQPAGRAPTPFAAPAARAAPPPIPQSSAVNAAALATNAAAQSARELAAAAADLDELREAMRAFEGCALKRSASHLVFEDGARGTRIMLIGEAPGSDEDKQGKPFAGRAGQLLDRMLQAIGLDRTQVYIANVVPWRPPGNRTPTPQETTICLPFIHRQIELANPDIIVCMGVLSIHTLLNSSEPLNRARGVWHDYSIGDGVKSIRALAALPLNYLLRTPSAKREAWKDLRALRKALDGE